MIIGGFALTGIATDQADPFSLSAEPLALGDEILYLDTLLSPLNLVRSFEVSPLDPLYLTYKDVCFVEDQALTLLASLAYRDTNSTRCDSLVNALLGLQDPVTKEFPAMVNPLSGASVPGLFRTKTQAMCAYALLLYGYYFPASSILPSCLTAARVALDKVLSTYSAAGYISGLYYDGSGTIDSNLNVTLGMRNQTQTIDGFWLWYALSLYDHLFNSSYYQLTLTSLQASLMAKAWNGVKFVVGGTPFALDTKDSLETTAMGTIWLCSIKDANRAKYLQSRGSLYQLDGIGYQPYLQAQWPTATPLIWMAGTFMTLLAMRRSIGDAQADIYTAVTSSMRSTKDSWTQALIQETLLVKKWPSACSTAWAILAMNQNIRSQFLVNIS